MTILKQKLESRIVESKEIFERILWPDFLRRCQKREHRLAKLLDEREKNKKIDFDFLLTSSALYSSNIEGNTLDLNSLMNKKFLSQKKKKESVEIEDLKKAYLLAKKYQLSEKNFLKAHQILSRHLVSKNRQGKYRQESVGVFDSQGLVYLAIESNLLVSEMKLFFKQVAVLLKKKMNEKEVFFWARWVHLMLVLIHPFIDGNGRIARLTEKWFLSKKLGQDYWLIQTEKYYWDNLSRYYQSLNLGANYWEVNFRKAKKFLNL